MEREQKLLRRASRCVILTGILLSIMLCVSGVFAAEKVTIHVDDMRRDAEVDRDGICILQDPEIRNSDEAEALIGKPFRQALVIGIPEGTQTIEYEINYHDADADIDPGPFTEMIDPGGGVKAIALIYYTEEVNSRLIESPLHIEYMSEDGEVIEELDASILWCESMADSYTLEGGEWVENDWETPEDDGFDGLLANIFH